MQERSGIQTNKPTQSLDSEHGITPQSSRRKFLTKASVGIVVASLPARSVWAGSSGIAQSIVASGHGSEFANSVKIALLSPGYWKNHYKDNHSLVFSRVFPGKAFDKSGIACLPDDTTFGTILTENGSTFKGCSSVNYHMVSMYLNALHTGKYGLVYPVVGDNKPFRDMAAFAAYLYNKAKISPDLVGAELSQIIKKFHVPSQSYK